MRIKDSLQRVTALAFIVGALPFLLCAGAYAGEKELTDEVKATDGKEIHEGSRWLDDYRAPVGFTYRAQARVQTTYLWRGLYAGGMNIQGDANVGYGGLYFDMWWNIGTTDWSFKTFQPEVDLALGFSRWGIDASVVFIHNFNCPFFDFSNHPYPSSGNALELDFRYTVSSKLPLSILWATRVSASDGYTEDSPSAAGLSTDTIRAYSTYIELSYTHHFAYGISLFGAVGVTPWRSLYTSYQRSFAVQNVEVRLRKDWDVSAHCGLMVQGVLSVKPWALAADKSTAEWHPLDPWAQSVNANLAVGVYLK